MQLHMAALSCHSNILHKNAGKATSLLIKALEMLSVKNNQL